HKVIANDMQYYSYVLNKNYIGNHKNLHFAGLFGTIPELVSQEIGDRKKYICKYLEELPAKKGFIYKNYTLGGTKGAEFERQYFSDENAMRCDAIRSKIENWKKKKLITENEYHFLLASLLESIDKVANTASVYGAFLKKLKKSAEKTLILKPADFFLNDHSHDVYNKDIVDLVASTSHEVVYLDPPYNHRQYSGNYHILETIAKYDSPRLKGKTGMRDCSTQKSLYCSRDKVKDAYRDLITKIDAKYIFLSYNDEGLMNLEDIKEIMSSRGEYGVLTQKYRRFKADKTENRNHKKNETIEYLHYVKVN
ncbi:MAG: DNA adenine methylase, partial [Candidatus Gracilibacteria bacterium]|nr:DNA adenine methylase [Candidatus Gracilibacteria bacterium]